MQENDEIFFDNNEQENMSSQPEQIKYIHNTQSDDFISQFLFDQVSHDLSGGKHESAPLILSRIGETNQTKQQKPQNFKKKGKRQKSLFHNFQKHLVITLKKMVRIKAKPQDSLVGKIGEQMWQIFLKSHLFTKTILHILYGAEQQQQQCSFTSAMLNKFGYVDLFNKYSQDLVKQTQKYLRQQTVKQVKRVNIKQYLSKRRLSKGEQFEDYLNEFIEQLSQGPIKRRIPKQKKKNLKAYIKAVKKHDQSGHNETQNKMNDQNKDQSIKRSESNHSHHSSNHHKANNDKQTHNHAQRDSNNEHNGSRSNVQRQNSLQQSLSNMQKSSYDQKSQLLDQGNQCQQRNKVQQNK